MELLLIIAAGFIVCSAWSKSCLCPSGRRLQHCPKHTNERRSR